VALIQANLAQRGAAVRPEVAPNKPDSGLNKFHLNPLRLRAADPRPGEIGEGSRETEHMRRAFRPPLPLTSIQRILSTMLELPELLECLNCFK
jgi:hypothetical protein